MKSEVLSFTWAQWVADDFPLGYVVVAQRNYGAPVTPTRVHGCKASALSEAERLSKQNLGIPFVVVAMGRRESVVSNVQTTISGEET